MSTSHPRRSRARLALKVLLVVGALIASTFAATPAHAASTCDDFGTIGMGKYYLNNNVWGQNSGSGWQCIWNNWQSGSQIGWGTVWDWSGQPYGVKSYDAAILGWHWGWRASNTGLPVRLSANRNITTGWSYNVRQSGTMNVAYDLWLHNVWNPDYYNQPTDEIMIWTYTAGGAGPAGTRQGTVYIGGASWDLYRGWINAGNGVGWNVFSFVRQWNTNNVTLNLRDFTGHLVGRGWVSNNKYLSSIQAGTEVFVGRGQFDVHSYYVNT